MKMHRKSNRPGPVSCESCRAKKLKCNRVQPCSNCAARGITCRFLQTQMLASSSSESGGNEGLGAHIVRRESYSRRQTTRDDGLTISMQETASADFNESRSTEFTFRNPYIYNERDVDSIQLENIGTREDHLLSFLSDGFEFKISSTRDILETIEKRISFSGSREPRHVIYVPRYHTAMTLIQVFETDVAHMCPILHLPTLRVFLKALYLRITEGKPICSNRIGLLLAVLALASFFIDPSENSTVVTTENEAVNLSKAFCKSALDVLDYSRRNTSGSLEDVQSSLILSLLIFHLDGFSARGRNLLTTGISIARDIRLHRIDARIDRQNRVSTSFRSLVDLELKRRVFWYMVSTDWFLSTVSGPQEGTYFLHANQFDVALPKSYAEDYLDIDDTQHQSHDLIPDGMTFLLEKIRLAHLCREMSDCLPLDTQSLLRIPYDRIIDFDQRLKEFAANLPFFFKEDYESRKKSTALEVVYPAIPVFRYCMMTAVHSRRCRLHQRFLLRSDDDSQYIYSRKACLESARTVIELYSDISKSHSLSTPMARMGMAVHFTHLALVVLVMDLCYNKAEMDTQETKAYVQSALNIFEDAKHASPLLDRYSTALTGLLRAHSIHGIELTDSAYEGAPDTSHTTTLLGTGTVGNSLTSLADQQDQSASEPNLAFDDSVEMFWQAALHSESGFDALSWDQLFSGIDWRPV